MNGSVELEDLELEKSTWVLMEKERQWEGIFEYSQYYIIG
jgi:hypothetical protein